MVDVDEVASELFARGKPEPAEVARARLSAKARSRRLYQRPTKFSRSLALMIRENSMTVSFSVNQVTIHNLKHFLSLLPRYFGFDKYDSFRRSMNRHDFVRGKFSKIIACPTLQAAVCKNVPVVFASGAHPVSFLYELNESACQSAPVAVDYQDLRTKPELCVSKPAVLNTDVPSQEAAATTLCNMGQAHR